MRTWRRTRLAALLLLFMLTAGAANVPSETGRAPANSGPSVDRPVASGATTSDASPKPRKRPTRQPDHQRTDPRPGQPEPSPETNSTESDADGNPGRRGDTDTIDNPDRGSCVTLRCAGPDERKKPKVDEDGPGSPAGRQKDKTRGKSIEAHARVGDGAAEPRLKRKPLTARRPDCSEETPSWQQRQPRSRSMPTSVATPRTAWPTSPRQCVSSG
jgi:hypothetical protein